MFRVEMRPEHLQDGDIRERLRVSEPGYRRTGSAEITMSPKSMTGATVAFDDRPAVPKVDTDPSRMVRGDVFGRPLYVARLSPTRPNSSAEESPIITDDLYMLVCFVGQKRDPGALSGARGDTGERGLERTGGCRAPRLTIKRTIFAVLVADFVIGLLLLFGQTP